MEKQNKHPCFADKGFSRCSILTVKIVKNVVLEKQLNSIKVID